MVECGTHAVFAADVGPLAEHETVLVWRLFDRLSAGMLLLADRGFVGFDLWRAASAGGADLLWRVKNSAVLPVAEALDDGSYLSQIVAARDKNRRADPITVRVIEYTLGTGADTTVYRLSTTILDPRATPADELAALYAQRWEIETTLDEIKTHQGRSTTATSQIDDHTVFGCRHSDLPLQIFGHTETTADTAMRPSAGIVHAVRHL